MLSNFAQLFKISIEKLKIILYGLEYIKSVLEHSVKLY